jgi:hypothetical protein
LEGLVATGFAPNLLGILDVLIVESRLPLLTGLISRKAMDAFLA